MSLSRRNDVNPTNCHPHVVCHLQRTVSKLARFQTIEFHSLGPSEKPRSNSGGYTSGYQPYCADNLPTEKEREPGADQQDRNQKTHQSPACPPKQYHERTTWLQSTS